MEPADVTVASYAGVRHAYRHRGLAQGLFDDGVVMDDVLINLHGDAHRERRRKENRLFRRSTFVHYERDLFPAIIEETLAPHLAVGRAELVSLGHQLMMNLAAVNTGIDRREGTAEETQRLYELMMTFIEGATIANYLGDKAELEGRVSAALADFETEFAGPSRRRREALLEAGETCPLDVVSTLVRDLDLSADVELRETAFYLLSGAHTTGTAFTRTLHQLLETGTSVADLAEAQACVHEVLRLEPPSPVRRRRALTSLELADGTEIAEGQIVDLDLVEANRDPSVFGSDADDFRPGRELPANVPPWGVSFGGGMHHCIGQDLAAGELEGVDPLIGVVPLAIHRMLAAGIRRDPDDPPVLDELTSRGYWKRYPVLLDQRLG